MKLYHWLGHEAEAFHTDLPPGMLITLPDDTPCPTQDELG